MKKWFTLVFLLCSMYAGAQMPAWTWAHANVNAGMDINPSIFRQSVAASGHTALWGNILNRKYLANVQYGDYQFTLFDSSGNAMATASAMGKLSVLRSQADGAGNWYVLAQYHDTVAFAGGPTLLQTPSGSEYCMFRLDAGTLHCSWLKAIGEDLNCQANCFAVANGFIYLPLDTDQVTQVLQMDPATGARSILWTQTGRSMSTSIQVDSKGNLYLAGSCAFDGGIDFNGHMVTLPLNFPYPQYLVRYHADGSYDWSQFMPDITCFVRELNLADDNTLYYTGPLNDSFTLGGVLVTASSSFGSFMAAKIDSAGQCSWVRKLSDTASGEASYPGSGAAAIGVNGSLILYTTTRGYVDWGNGIHTTTTPSWHYTGSVTAFGKNGDALWNENIRSNIVTPNEIAFADNNIWVSGNAWDSTQLMFGNISLTVPTAPFQYYPFVGRLYHSTVVNSINNPDKNDDLRILPNPADRYFMITGPAQAVTVRVFEETGRMTLKQTVQPGEKINTAAWARGLYFVHIFSEKGERAYKLVLE